MENNGISFIQLPLPVFVKLYPDIVSKLPPGLDLSDKNYIVRWRPGYCSIEFGYPEDDWLIS